MESHSKEQKAWVRFSDPFAAFDEMEYMVKETGRSHLIIKTKAGLYRVVQKGSQNTNKGIVCELNVRNVVGDREINARRGVKPKGRVEGVKRAVS